MFYDLYKVGNQRVENNHICSTTTKYSARYKYVVGEPEGVWVNFGRTK